MARNGGCMCVGAIPPPHTHTQQPQQPQQSRSRSPVTNQPTHRCTPEHSRQNRVPKLTEAHCGCCWPQSAHLPFPGRARTAAWSVLDICDMFVVVVVVAFFFPSLFVVVAA